MRVAHSCYRVTDLDRSLAFYALLGFEEEVRLPLHDSSGWASFIRLPGDSEPRVELWFMPGSGSHEPGAGYGHIGVAVDDLDALLGELSEKGIAPLMEPFKPHPDGPTRLAFISDPDGYEVELLEHYPY
ncbi:MAG TPA: VOC family protein [Solirubrobacteraceae bacterium]|jgi:lactoylglutathione lyase|nr:VOC family protein [Solirubrobacteraceae bacterium]